LKKLLEKARTDSDFFHQLVFDPEKAISRLDYLDRKAKSDILRFSADQLLRNMLPPDVLECDTTCGGTSCGTTCGGSSCLTTCGSSCGTTCASSCDDTGKFEWVVEEDPGLAGQVAGAAVGRVGAGGARARRRGRARRG
jgi:hypothetical protein